MSIVAFWAVLMRGTFHRMLDYPGLKLQVLTRRPLSSANNFLVLNERFYKRLDGPGMGSVHRSHKGCGDADCG